MKIFHKLETYFKLPFSIYKIIRRLSCFFTIYVFFLNSFNPILSWTHQLMIGVLLGGGQQARTCRTHAFWPQLPTPRQFFRSRDKSAKEKLLLLKICEKKWPSSLTPMLQHSHRIIIQRQSFESNTGEKFSDAIDWISTFCYERFSWIRCRESGYQPRWKRYKTSVRKFYSFYVFSTYKSDS